MDKFYCNGKKDFCDTYDGKTTANCWDCIHHDDTGGEVVEFITQFDRIKSMNIVELAGFMNECGWDFPPYCSHAKSMSCDQNCLMCAEQWLESEVIK